MGVLAAHLISYDVRIGLRPAGPRAYDINGKRVIIRCLGGKLHAQVGRDGSCCCCSLALTPVTWAAPNSWDLHSWRLQTAGGNTDLLEYIEKSTHPDRSSRSVTPPRSAGTSPRGSARSSPRNPAFRP